MQQEQKQLARIQASLGRAERRNNVAAKGMPDKRYRWGSEEQKKSRAMKYGTDKGGCFPKFPRGRLLPGRKSH